MFSHQQYRLLSVSLKPGLGPGQAVGEQTWYLPHGEEISGKLLQSKEEGSVRTVGCGANWAGGEDRIGRLWVFVDGAKEAPQGLPLLREQGWLCAGPSKATMPCISNVGGRSQDASSQNTLCPCS